MSVAQALGAVGGVIALAACAAPNPGVALRDPSVIQAGTVRFQPAAFAGNWVTVACIGPCARSEQFELVPSGALNRRTADGSVTYRQVAPGVLEDTRGDGRLVILWVDEGFRTAAISSAAGEWAAILDRSGRNAADRVAAAKEILDFNGWDISQLRDVKT